MQELAAMALAAAREAGASDAAVNLPHRHQVEVAVRDEALESTRGYTDQGLSLEAWTEGCYLRDSTPNLRGGEIRHLARTAVARVL